MVEIVRIDAAEKCKLLCELWARIGGHSTSNAAKDIEGAYAVLLGSSDMETVSALSPRLAGKILIDCSNPANLDDLRTQPPWVEVLAAMIPGTRVVKAFNACTLDDLLLASKHGGPEFGNVYPCGFYCGDDTDAKQMVVGLSEELNLTPIDCGALSNAVLLEGLGLLGDYLKTRAFSSFAIALAGPKANGSPMDRWM